MIKNIPNKYTQKMLLTTIDEKFRGTYDFFYLPIDFKNKCNVGYAFINMVRPAYIIPLIQKFDRKKWEKFNSEKVCNISYARIQVHHFTAFCLPFTCLSLALGCPALAFRPPDLPFASLLLAIYLPDLPAL